MLSSQYLPDVILSILLAVSHFTFTKKKEYCESPIHLILTVLLG